jgi:hypothetical protein
VNWIVLRLFANHLSAEILQRSIRPSLSITLIEGHLTATIDMARYLLLEL